MFSKKNLTIILVVALVALSYQTVALAKLSFMLQDGQISLGTASAAVSFIDDGGTPNMVGGC